MVQKLYPIKLYLKHPLNLILLPLGLLFNLASWMWLATQIQSQPESIFLHYNVLFGVDLIGPWFHVYLVPLLGFVILLVNAIIAWLLFQRDRFFLYILNPTAFFCQVILFIIVALLIFLNV